MKRATTSKTSKGESSKRNASKSKDEASAKLSRVPSRNPTEVRSAGRQLSLRNESAMFPTEIRPAEGVLVDEVWEEPIHVSLLGDMEKARKLKGKQPALTTSQPPSGIPKGVFFHTKEEKKFKSQPLDHTLVELDAEDVEMLEMTGKQMFILHPPPLLLGSSMKIVKLNPQRLQTERMHL